MFLSKYAKKRIEQAMPKRIKALYKNGDVITVKMYRYDGMFDHLGNEAEIKIKKGRIISNSLIGKIEDCQQDKERSAVMAIDYLLYGQDKERSAVMAIDYFLYGERMDYAIIFDLDGEKVRGRGKNAGYYYAAYWAGNQKCAVRFDRYRDAKRFFAGWSETIWLRKYPKYGLPQEIQLRA